MNGLILEIRGLHAIVLMPGGEMRRMLRRRGWQVGMIVDPDAAHRGGFARAAIALAMVLVLMLGLGAYHSSAPRSDNPVMSQPTDRVPLTLSTREPNADPSELAVAPLPSPEATADAAPSPTPTRAAKSRRDDDDDDDDDDDYCYICHEYGHEADDNCRICGVHGHEDDDHCDYCGQFGHDDDDCPYAPPGWDDDDDDDD